MIVVVLVKVQIFIVVNSFNSFRFSNYQVSHRPWAKSFSNSFGPIRTLAITHFGCAHKQLNPQAELSNTPKICLPKQATYCFFSVGVVVGVVVARWQTKQQLAICTKNKYLFSDSLFDDVDDVNNSSQMKCEMPDVCSGANLCSIATWPETDSLPSRKHGMQSSENRTFRFRFPMLADFCFSFATI